MNRTELSASRALAVGQSSAKSCLCLGLTEPGQGCGCVLSPASEQETREDLNTVLQGELDIA